MSGTGTRTLLTCLLAATLAGCGSGAESPPQAAESAAVEPSAASGVPGCEELADQAVRISRGEDVELLKVRDPRVVKDRRETVEVPSGSGDALILLCEGRGVWSDGSDDMVRFKATVDSDRDTFVYYEAVN